MWRRVEYLSSMLKDLGSWRSGESRFSLSISVGSAQQRDFSDGSSVIAGDWYSSLGDRKPCFMTAIMMESE